MIGALAFVEFAAMHLYEDEMTLAFSLLFL